MLVGGRGHGLVRSDRLTPSPTGEINTGKKGSMLQTLAQTGVKKEWRPCGGSNLARGKPTRQSTNCCGGSSGRAVDGNHNRGWGGRSCTHTHANPNEWWRVDIGHRSPIARVYMWNRSDCCGHRLHRAHVKVYDSSSTSRHTMTRGPWCRKRSYGQVQRSDCHGRVGRYVAVVIHGRDYLTLCEVKVVGLCRIPRPFYPPGTGRWAQDRSKGVVTNGKRKYPYYRAKINGQYYTVWSNSIYSSHARHGPDKLFDKTGRWWATHGSDRFKRSRDKTGTPIFVAIQMPGPMELLEYSIQSRTDGAPYQAPRTWKLESSSDGRNFKLVVKVNSVTRWRRGEVRLFKTKTNKKGTVYKFTWLRNNGRSRHVAMREIKLNAVCQTACVGRTLRKNSRQQGLQCFDLTKSWENCGKCGQKCFGHQTCTNGKCVNKQTKPGAIPKVLDPELKGQQVTCKTIQGPKKAGSVATCPDGYIVFSGGARQHRRIMDKNSRTIASMPVGSNGWIAQIGIQGQAFARCCKVHATACKTVSKEATGKVSVNCPAKFKIVGGGFSISGFNTKPFNAAQSFENPRPVYLMPYVYKNHPVGNGWEVEVGPDPMKVTAWARCCTERMQETTSVVKSKPSKWAEAKCGNQVMVGGGWTVTRPKSYASAYAKYTDEKMMLEDTWPAGNHWAADLNYGTVATNVVAEAVCFKFKKDTDRCKEDGGNGGCDSHVKCKYTLGSYAETTCAACPSGTTGKSKLPGKCVDTDECLDTSNPVCDSLTTCTNKFATYKCGPCPSGYTGDGKKGCEDIDECLESNGGCDKLVQCKNHPGHHKCDICPVGYKRIEGKGVCPDIDECRTNNGGCDKKVDCVNTRGSRTCGKCPTGWVGPSDVKCTDLNECASANGGCDINRKCINTVGSFKCGPCAKGYKDHGKACKDINECKVKVNGGCHIKRECINLPGTHKCGRCGPGWEDSGDYSCTDFDECKVNNGGCDPLSECTNTPGGNTCGKCPAGYTGNGKIGCKDVNECKQKNGDCFNKAPCVNTPGSRKCGPCPTGYKGRAVGYEDGCYNVAHQQKWHDMSKLDIARLAAKDAADATHVHVQTLAEEKQKDAERRQKIYQRNKDIRNLDEGVEVLKTELMRKKEKEDKRAAQLLHADATNTYFNAIKKISGMANEFYTGKKSDVPDEDEAQAKAEAEAGGNKEAPSKSEEKKEKKEDAKEMKEVQQATGEAGVGGTLGDDST